MSSRIASSQNFSRLVCVADPLSLRWQAFEDAIQEFISATGKDIQVDLIDWRELIAVDGDLPRLQDFSAAPFSERPAWLRIESPARDFGVTRALLAAGASQTGLSDDTRWSEVEFEKGKLVEPHLVFEGFKRVLTKLGRSVEPIQGLELLTNPLDNISMFDKNHTSRRLLAAGISTPEIDEYIPWKLQHHPRDYRADEFKDAALDFIAELKELNWNSAYIKLESGSSASGMLFLELQNDFGFRSMSTMISIEGSFYNTRSPQTLDAEGLGHRLNYLFHQGATVQQGIKKSQIGSENFDVRVIVINGKVEFTIFRVSRHPFTNLHLGGYRGDWQQCRSAIPDRAWLDAMDDCVGAAELFQAHIVGVDLAFDRNYLKHYIIELNPFGDFIPGWKNEKGELIYQVELMSLFET